MSYQFDHQWQKERARLAALEATFDPWSQRAVRTTGPKRGWRCLEVGGGGGSMAEWLCELVGPEGEVVATDVETKFLRAIKAENLKVREHDISRDPLEDGGFDLIHIRAVLAHLPERDEILRHLIAALKPGGWLVPVVADFSSVRAVQCTEEEDGQFFDRAFATVTEAARAIGFDPYYGRRIGAALRENGLEAVHVEGVIFEWDSEHPLGALYRMTFDRLRDLVVGNGALSESEMNRLLGIMASTGFHALSNTLLVGRGRMPGGS